MKDKKHPSTSGFFCFSCSCSCQSRDKQVNCICHDVQTTDEENDNNDEAMHPNSVVSRETGIMTPVNRSSESKVVTFSDEDDEGGLRHHGQNITTSTSETASEISDTNSTLTERLDHFQEIVDTVLAILISDEADGLIELDVAAL